jgi:hypothetical protein
VSNKITWWPASMASNILSPTCLLMRYDWPDERIYQFCIYDPSRLLSPWTDGHGGILQVPDFFTDVEHITEFIKIPAEREFTYEPKKSTRGD